MSCQARKTSSTADGEKQELDEISAEGSNYCETSFVPITKAVYTSHYSMRGRAEDEIGRLLVEQYQASVRAWANALAAEGLVKSNPLATAASGSIEEKGCEPIERIASSWSANDQISLKDARRLSYLNVLRLMLLPFDRYTRFASIDDYRNSAVFGLGLTLSWPSINHYPGQPVSTLNVLKIADCSPLAAGTIVRPLANAAPFGLPVTELYVDDSDNFFDDSTSEEIMSHIQSATPFAAELIFEIENERLAIEARSKECDPDYTVTRTMAPVGYLRLESFGSLKKEVGKISLEMLRSLRRLEEDESVEVVVVDIRGNSGGLIATLSEVVTMFLGPRVYAYRSYGYDEQNNKPQFETLGNADTTSKKEATLHKPVFLLVDEFTASSSEILALTLSKFGVAKIVGPNRTRGKFITQSFYDRFEKPENSAEILLGRLAVTDGYVFGLDGETPHRLGLMPDYVIEEEGLADAQAAKNQRGHDETSDGYGNFVYLSDYDPAKSMPAIEEAWEFDASLAYENLGAFDDSGLAVLDDAVERLNATQCNALAESYVHLATVDCTLVKTLELARLYTQEIAPVAP